MVRFIRGIVPPFRVARFLLLASFLVSVAGCGDDAAGPIGGDDFLSSFALWTASPDPTYGQLYVTSSWSLKSNYAIYRSGGQIFTATDHNTLVSGGTAVASDLVMTTMTGQYVDLRDHSGPTFGAVSHWSLSGNPSAGIPAFVDSMYVPAEIRITAPGSATASISKGGAMVVQWPADANNGKILIVLEYMPDESQMRDSTLSGTPYTWKAITDDDGLYTIDVSALSALPVGGLFKLTLARGASKTTGTPSKPFHIYAYSTAVAVFAVAS